MELKEFNSENCCFQTNLRNPCYELFLACSTMSDRINTEIQEKKYVAKDSPRHVSGYFWACDSLQGPESFWASDIIDIPINGLDFNLSFKLPTLLVIIIIDPALTI